MRHLEIKDLWLQKEVAEGKVKVFKTPGSENPADLMTKILTWGEILVRLGFMNLEAVGVLEERANASDGRKSISQLMLFGEFCFGGGENRKLEKKTESHQINQIKAVLCRSPRAMEGGSTRVGGTSLVEIGSLAVVSCTANSWPSLLHGLMHSGVVFIASVMSFLPNWSSIRS